MAQNAWARSHFFELEMLQMAQRKENSSLRILVMSLLCFILFRKDISFTLFLSDIVFNTCHLFFCALHVHIFKAQCFSEAFKSLSIHFHLLTSYSHKMSCLSIGFYAIDQHKVIHNWKMKRIKGLQFFKIKIRKNMEKIWTQSHTVNHSCVCAANNILLVLC